jgi:diadenosine tetraphosphate (Ap4A) HIT family hydrolase
LSVYEQVEAARSGKEPTLICQVPSGWVVLCKMQFLRGYCILMPDPIVQSLNNLNRQGRATFLDDMAIVGDALQAVTDAYRINYAIMGNADQVLHAHIVPRYLTEPDEMRSGTPWSYPQETMDTILFDFERDKDLIIQLGLTIRNIYTIS